MGIVNIDLNTSILNENELNLSSAHGGIDDSAISDKMFGLNFLSSFENCDGELIGSTYKEIISALKGEGDLGGIAYSQGTSHGNLRFPGGTLTEQFYAEAGAKLCIDAPVNYAGKPGVSAKQFLDFCAETGRDMSQVMPTWRYLADGAKSAESTAEISQFVSDLLLNATAQGVNINSFEIGNEYWGNIRIKGIGNVRMTPEEYGAIAAQQALLIQRAIEDFKLKYSDLIASMGNWREPDILVQLGSQNDDYQNIGNGKALRDSRIILDAFQTTEHRAAVDGFVTHRYETHIDHVSDPYIKNKTFHFDALAPFLGDNGWKSLDEMTLSVSEWNVSQQSQETGLRSFSMVVALMGEMTRLGVDSADFWSVAARSNFPLAYFNQRFSPNTEFDGLTFTGEAFRMMYESIIGLRPISLFDKTGLVLTPRDGNILDLAAGNNLRTNIETFAGEQEVVIFLSNLSGEDDIINLDIGGMVGGSNFFAWASVVKSTSGDPLDQNGRPEIINFTLTHSNGILGGIRLDAHESIRITVTIGTRGAEIFGYDLPDILAGGMQSDVIAGRLGDDSLSGMNGHDTIYGGAGGDELHGGAGNDLLDGGDGGDFITGGAGRNIIIGGDGCDTAAYFSARPVRIDLMREDFQNTGPSWDQLIGIENILTGRGADWIAGDNSANHISAGLGHDVIYGHGGDDLLKGEGGTDRLFGGAGNDSLHGGAGRDVLHGGDGADCFVFAQNAGSDRIVDFQSGLDLIHFAQAGLGFDDLRMTQVGAGVMLAYGRNTLVIEGARLADLDAADFIFG